MREWTTARWLAPVLIAVVSLAVAGGVLAREFYQREKPEAVAVALPTTTSLKPSDQPGPREVQLSPDAAQHPYGQTVRSLLQAWMDGINDRNYEKWKTAVTIDRVRKSPKHQWLKDFGTTRNGSLLVRRIESAPNGTLRVLVSFTSTQAPEHAPERTPGATCNRWDLAWPLVLEDGQWKIAAVPKGTGGVQVYREC